MDNASLKIMHQITFDLKDLDQVIQDIGNGHFRDNYRPFSKEQPLIFKILETKEDILPFLNEIGFTKGENGGIELTDIGKTYFQHKFIFNDEKRSMEVIREAILNYEPVKTICSILFGKPHLTKPSIKNVLVLYEKISPDQDVTKLIKLLNKLKIISYSTQTGKITILEKSEEREDITHYYITPEKPYSNVNAIKTIIRNADEYLYWFEKHYSPKILELVANNVDGTKTKIVKILTGHTNLKEETRKEFKRLDKELKNKEIHIEFRIITKKQILNNVHDRWIITKSKTFNIPPINSILQGQVGEIIRTKENKDFEKWWAEGEDVISCWDKIRSSMGE